MATLPSVTLDLTFNSFSSRVVNNFLPTEFFKRKYNVVKQYYNIPPYNDEPKFYHIAVQVNISPHLRKGVHIDLSKERLDLASGTSLEKNRALWKAVGEAVERYALWPRAAPLEYASFDSFPLDMAIDPNSICAGTTAACIDKHSFPMQWIEGFSVKDGRGVRIPGQMVYVPYFAREGEFVFRVPITTGAAAGFSLEDALYKGICEVIERDAFMVAWLRQLKLTEIIPDIEVPGCPEEYLLLKTINSALRYKLNPRFFLLPSDTPTTTILCTLWDLTNHIPKVTIGMKTDFSLMLGLLGSLEEAHQIRAWTRRLYKEMAEQPVTENLPLSPQTLEERAILWLADDSIRHLSSWLENCSDCIKASSYPISYSSTSLGELIEDIRKSGCTVYGVDLSDNLPSGLKATGFKVVKAIIPEFQPLYLDERHKDYAWNRLLSAESRLDVKSLGSPQALTSFPHPFL
jgi:ribosomal protein S12 methylthiotransferase accessory factor